MPSSNPSNTADLFQRIWQYDQSGNLQLLKLKYERMQQNLFSFFRGTCHLFYADWPSDIALNHAPLTWICGDLHLENFGTYKSDFRLTYFDLNDFDEAVLAPCTWDLARFLTSILIATQTIKIEESVVLSLCESFLNSYRGALLEGKAYWVERATASGLLAELLEATEERKRKDLLEERTEERKGKRKIRIDDKRSLPISSPDRAKITDFITKFAAQQPDPHFFELVDVAGRVAGTASLGRERYVLLVEGKGSLDGNYLLDLKQSCPSALAPYVAKLEHCQQPKWTNQAERIVAVQKRMQATAIAFLQPVTINKQAYILRELQPSQCLTDVLEIAKWTTSKIEQVQQITSKMGEVVAWGQLRSAGRQGSAIADELITFAQDQQWSKDLLEYARHYSQKVQSDWQEFQAPASKFLANN